MKIALLLLLVAAFASGWYTFSTYRSLSLNSLKMYVRSEKFAFENRETREESDPTVGIR